MIEHHEHDWDSFTFLLFLVFTVTTVSLTILFIHEHNSLAMLEAKMHKLEDHPK